MFGSKKRTARSGKAMSAPGRSTGCMVLFFGVFLLAGLGFSSFFALAIWRSFDSRSWDSVPCRILSSSVGSSTDSDGDTTYSVDIRYEYETAGASFKSERYQFLGGSSSGRRGKQRVVERYPAGSTATCFVDPEDPGSAVIERGLTRDMWFGLLPLVFVLVGGGGIVGSLAAARGTSGARSAKKSGLAGMFTQHGHESRTGVPPSVPDNLLTVSTRRNEAIGLTIGLAVMNVVGFFFLRHADRAALEGQAGLFDWILVAAHVLLVSSVGVTALYAWLAAKNPTFEISLGGDLHVGSSVDLVWRARGDTRRLETLRICVVGREQAIYRRGTNTYTDHETFYEQVVFDSMHAAGTPQGHATITIPPGTMHSFDGGNNAVQWLVELHCDIPQWPDVKQQFALSVQPTHGDDQGGQEPGIR